MEPPIRKGYPTDTPSLSSGTSSQQQRLRSSYARNSKAIGVLWGVFTICFAIIDIVVFLQPHWLGDTRHSKGTGHFGLWQFCRLVQDGQEVVCQGRLDALQAAPSTAFRAATVFVGISVIAVLLCIGCMLLFFVAHSSTVFHVCGWLQVLCALCLVTGVLAFPAGWGAEEVRDVCGPEAGIYEPAQCGIRWAYILAIIGVCDCTTLAALAFVLGTRYVKLLPNQYITNGGASYFKGEANAAFLVDNKSGLGDGLHPHLGPPSFVSAGPLQHQRVMDPDRFSEYSRRSGKSSYAESPHYNIKSNYRI